MRQGLTINITSSTGTTHSIVHAGDTERGNGDLYYLEPRCGLQCQPGSRQVYGADVPKGGRAMTSGLGHPPQQVSLDHGLRKLEFSRALSCCPQCLPSRQLVIE